MNDLSLIECARQALTAAGLNALPDYALTRLKVDINILGSSAAACAAIDDFAPTSGWLQHCSAVRLWQGNCHQQDGPLLAGEFVNGPVSLHVRYGPAGWSLIKLTEGEGEPVFVHSHRFESVPTVSGTTVPGHGVRYRVYLQRLREVGIRAVQARFIGFGEE